MSRSPYPELERVMERMAEERLHHLKRNLIMLYAVKGGLDGEVREMAGDLAGQMGVSLPAFSRARSELERDGWLDLTQRYGQVKGYRLGEKATGSRVVIPLRA